MIRTLRHALLAATLLGGIGFAGMPAQAMPINDLAPGATSAAPALAGQPIKVYWRRHWAGHRRWGWHRHWGWRHRWHRW